MAAHRQLTLSMGMGMDIMGFTIDGRQFNEARTDTTVAAGSVEEWTLGNTSPMDHPFHLHMWPMQIIEESGRAHPRPRRPGNDGHRRSPLKFGLKLLCTG